MLKLDALAVGYSGTRGSVLRDISLEVTPGGFVCVLGRNGVGKSTLMRTIAGLQPALNGSASLQGQDIASLSAAERARQIAVVLTERAGSAGLTVEEVIGFGRMPYTRWNGVLSAADADVISEALRLSGAHALAGRLFDDLSDGERQRVMIARAIAQQPRLMVLDEITAFLDLPGRVEVMSLLRRQARQSGSIVLLSSHDLDLSLQLADRLWLLDGSGQVLAGTADELVDRGVIGRAFDTSEVAFSIQRRRFELVDARP